MNHEHDYVRPEGATPFADYRLPKVLFTDSDLRGMSSGAKLLYAMLLDRTGISIRNGWIDGEQRVYIIYPMEEVKEMLNVSDKTASKFLRGLDDDAATILMVDSNLQRETLLPSERAYAYKMKLEAMSHQGERRDITCGQIGHKLQIGKKSRELLAEQAGDNARNVQRYIRLTHLIPALLDMVDRKQISFNPAVELSYLQPEEQQYFIEAYAYGGEVAPSLSQAQRMKRLSQAKMCTLEAMYAVMSEDKKVPEDRVVFKSDDLRSYFPQSYSNEQIRDTISQLLEQWQKRRDRNPSL